MPKNILSNIIYLAAVLFFVFVIFLPAIYVLSFAIGGKITISNELARSLYVSFLVAFIVTIADLFFGVALAWVFARTRSKYKIWLDNLIDLPLIAPTAALGLSVYLFWGENWNISRGLPLIILLHIIFLLYINTAKQSSAGKKFNRGGY